VPVGDERNVHGTLVVYRYQEGLYMGDEHSPDDPLVKASAPTFGSNVFADAELLEMRAHFQYYHERMKMLGNQMIEYLSQALGLDDVSYLPTHVTEYKPVILPRMVRYRPPPTSSFESYDNPNEEPHWGIGRQSDYGLWTMILTDPPGLEFQIESSGDWVSVPFVPHSSIMNVGHVLDRLTSGRYISPCHRTRHRSSPNDRLSLPFLYYPAWDARLQTLPLPEAEITKKNPRPARWKSIDLTLDLDGSVAYSEFLAKIVANVFPDIVPEEYWNSLQSTSALSTQPALEVQKPDIVVTQQEVVQKVQEFYRDNLQIKVSHGWTHVQAVYNHACQAVTCHQPPLLSRMAMEIRIAALLHDVDDHKYFPDHENHENARYILMRAKVPAESVDSILYMISLVSCSKNGNHVPPKIAETENYHLLIPRWSDRLDAVGKVGIVRCYQYTQEQQRPLSSPRSPRAQSQQELWELVTPQRYEAYQETGASEDMISHYYDKLLHIACPPKDIVRNSYLERIAEESARELVEVCLRFGKTGQVDEEYILQLADEWKMEAAQAYY
jgi:uncharacterized protein